MFDQLSDEDLLAASASDAEAFGCFYLRYADGILAFFGWRTAQPETAADLTSETFAAALISLPNYSPERAPAVAWLFGIARNKLADSYRRGRVESEARKRLNLEPLVLEDSDLARVEEIASMSPLEPLSYLEHLPLEQREAVRARIVDEATYPDIAVKLDCSEAVVRQRVSRGLRSLKTRLESTR